MNDTQTLKVAIEAQHFCRAKFAQTVPIREKFLGKPVWQGAVHVFDLEGRPRPPEPMRANAMALPLTRTNATP